MKGRSSGSPEDGDESPNLSVAGEPSLADQSRSQPDASSHENAEVSARSTKRHLSNRPSPARSRRPASSNWKHDDYRRSSLSDSRESPATSSTRPTSFDPSATASPAFTDDPGDESRDADRRSGFLIDKMPVPHRSSVRWSRAGGSCAVSLLAFLTSLFGVAILFIIFNSLRSYQIEEKGCRMSYMRPSYVHFRDFDTEHTRFATKYSLHLYREQGIDDGRKLRGVPVLFVPGNAGSYRQVRPVAAEAARYYRDFLETDVGDAAADTRSLDFFTVDFNEDITAFHGQTLLDQAEYLNEAIRYILSLYLDPRMADRDVDLPEPTSVLVLGHSMGGIVARTMLTIPSYQANSINTIITLSAPHSRAPVTFDGQIVSIYNDINDYWRQGYSQKWANNNPLWHVTLVSIAGGGLDTVVPSDYASVESLVPETHGFTVFTTGIPTVWSAMDHQAILWCDQFRKVIVRAMYDVVDVRRTSQTKPRADRMRILRKWFLTGLERSAEKSLPSSEPTTLLTLEDDSDAIMAQGELLVLRHLGHRSTPQAHLLPIPPQGSPGGKQFTLLTDAALGKSGEQGKLEVLLCSISPVTSTSKGGFFPVHIDLSGNSRSATELLCKNAALDSTVLPSSAASSRYPFVLEKDVGSDPFSYLQYDIEDIADHQFVAVIDKSAKRSKNFLVAEFSDYPQSHRTRDIGLRQLFVRGVSWALQADRPMMTEIHLPSLQSSLVAYNLDISAEKCGEEQELFAPLLRQHLSRPYESKFVVNVKHAAVSVHGVAPFVPPPMTPKPKDEQGLTLQFWTDPTCHSGMEVTLVVDIMGSMGKLYMRYRTVFAAFPLLVVALVLRKQFKVYDSTGVFKSFSESLDVCLRQSLPLVLLSLTLLSLSSKALDSSALGLLWDAWDTGSASPAADFHSNDLLTGTQDPLFWFLIPLIGIVCIGVCAILHYLTIGLTFAMGIIYGWTLARPIWQRYDGQRRPQVPAFAPSSPRRRIIVMTVLLLMVAMCIPYQFAYLVACLCQLFTTMRALRIATEVGSNASHDFYNYSHSILLLMLWVLPINLPILAVWIRNLLVHWLTPFSSHHNVLSIMPFLILVENLSTGNMVPRVAGKLRHLTSTLLFATAIYAAIYGVSYAYMLHYLVNTVVAWLVVIHTTSDGWSLTGISFFQNHSGDQGQKRGKAP